MNVNVIAQFSVPRCYIYHIQYQCISYIIQHNLHNINTCSVKYGYNLDLLEQ